MKLANFFMPKNNSEPAAINRGPIGDIADAGNGAVVVTNYDDDTVSLLDASTLAVAGVVSVPGEPVTVAASDDRAYVSTSSETHDAVAVIDTVTRTVIAKLGVASKFSDAVLATVITPVSVLMAKALPVFPATIV